MKILIVSEQNHRRAKLIRWLNKHDAIVASFGSFRGIQLLEEIARTTPHLVLYGASGINEDTAAVLDYIAKNFDGVQLLLLPHCKFTWVLPQIWKRQIESALVAPLAPLKPLPYPQEPRLIFHDPLFDDFTTGEKLCLESPNLDRQIARVWQILQAGQSNHLRAKTYLQALEASQPGLELEISYRIGRGSYKGLAWARDLIGKWVAVLAHYVVGVEVRYLPLPVAIHSAIDYVAYGMPVESQYAIYLVLTLLINPTFSEMFLDSGGWIFTGQRGRYLMAEQAQLWGFARLLRHVALAQVSLLDQWLDPAWSEPPEKSCQIRRAEGIFRDFWDVQTLFDSGDALSALVKGFHDGTGTPGYSYPPPELYSEFLKSVSGSCE